MSGFLVKLNLKDFATIRFFAAARIRLPGADRRGFPDWVARRDGRVPEGHAGLVSLILYAYLHGYTEGGAFFS